MIKKIIGHWDVQHIMILQTKTITSVLKDLTYMYIITSITAHPIRLAVIQAINNVYLNLQICRISIYIYLLKLNGDFYSLFDVIQ